MRCAVFIATSLDGCIARTDGDLDWLPQDGDLDGADDHGHEQFVAGVDVMVMGRATYDTVVGFGVGWPYDLPVVVLTNRPLDDAPDGADVRTASGPVTQVVARRSTQARDRWPRPDHLDPGSLTAHIARPRRAR